MGSAEIIGTIFFILLGAWGCKKAWDWLSKKSFKPLEERKWLKIIVTAIVGYCMCGVFLIGTAIKIAINVADKYR